MSLERRTPREARRDFKRLLVRSVWRQWQPCWSPIAGGQTGLLDTLMGRGRFGGETRATARDVMRTPPVTVAADTPVAEAAQRMLGARRKVLPITDAGGRLLGVVDRADLLRHVRELGELEGNG